MDRSAPKPQAAASLARAVSPRSMAILAKGVLQDSAKA